MLSCAYSWGPRQEVNQLPRAKRRKGLWSQKARGRAEPRPQGTMRLLLPCQEKKKEWKEKKKQQTYLCTQGVHKLKLTREERIKPM